MRLLAAVLAAITLTTGFALPPTVDWDHVFRVADHITEIVEEQPGPVLTDAEIALRRCESGGDYTVVNPTGTYRGAWQFGQTSWDAAMAEAGRVWWIGADPITAPKWVQDIAMRSLAEIQTFSNGWPQCGPRVGLYGRPTDQGLNPWHHQ